MKRASPPATVSGLVDALLFGSIRPSSARLASGLRPNTSVTFAKDDPPITISAWNPLTRTPSWLAEHWRGAALIACAVGAITVLRWNYDKDPEHRARTQEKDLHSLAEKISKYALAMQEKYPSGSVVVSEEDLAGALHRAPERIARALGLLHSQQKVERAPLSGYWKLNVPLGSSEE